MKTKITDGINGVADILKTYNATEDQLILLNYKGTDEKMQAAKKWLIGDIIAEVFNEGKTPKDGWGWLPYYNPQRGFAFSGSDCVYWGSFSVVGSRLAFINREDSDFAGKAFPEIYLPLVTKNKI